jgi:hypothetical protein
VSMTTVSSGAAVGRRFAGFVFMLCFPLLKKGSSHVAGESRTLFRAPWKSDEPHERPGA